MTTISRVLGLVRDQVIAYYFGANFKTDAFFVAFKIPNLFRRMFAEGAFNQAFVPVLSEYKEQRDQQEVRQLVGATLGALSVVLLAITAIGVLAAPIVITIFAPGFSESPDKITLASDMLRWTFPYLLFISLTALFGGVLNTYGRFAVPAFTPALLNVAIIAIVLFLAPHLDRPIMSLAIGVFVGGVAQLLLQVLAAGKIGLLGPVRVGFANAGVKKIMRLMAPAMFGASVSQINLLLDTLIASLLTAGSISWLYYSDRLVEFPLGVFGIALATVILPNLSRQFTRGDDQMFSQTLDWALRLVWMIATPAALALAVLATPLIATIFFYGEFGERDLAMASQSLVAYSFGLIAFILIKILAPAYFSRQDTKTPVKVGIVAMIVNLTLNLLLMGPL
ncbi:MAG: murein biosynthesis integral membrane protein MurJ, partial [Gammaproteobacteria bacterium]